jgi:phosphatidylglycerol:prolipoprotein diacylglycerol transferase
MLPALPTPVLRFGTLQVSGFAILFAAALASGYWRAVSRAGRKGLDPYVASVVAIACIAVGLLCAHLYAAATSAAPFCSIRGISTLGGLFGGLTAAVLGFAIFRIGPGDALRYLDIYTYVYPLSGAIGRLGCALAHDHLGAAGSSWLAVRFPAGPRYDLGLVEFLFLVVLALTFRLLDRHPRPAGRWLGWSMVTYGAFRFGLGFLSKLPAIAWGLTADQYSALLLCSIENRGQATQSPISSSRENRRLRSLSPVF